MISLMNEHSPWLPPALLGILTGCSGGTPTPPSAGGSVVDTGARLYDANCIACHQPDARGIPGVYPSLVGSPVVLGDPKDLALWVVKGQRPPSMPAGRYSTAMPQFAWLKPGDAAALCTYLRASFGNAAVAVDAATLARVLGEPP
jgi:mono/diheme cytochrome c family protein